MTKQSFLLSIASAISALLLFSFINLLFIKYNGNSVSVPRIPRGPQQFGSGSPLTYVVMGDSTAISQGSKYSDGYAVASAKHLAEKYRVTFVNTGVSGAVAKDIAEKQLDEAKSYKPDIVLIAVGANDVTHFTNQQAIDTSIQKAVGSLKRANSGVSIILTGSAAMDSVDRFTWPAKQLAFLRVKLINKTFDKIIERNNLTLAPIADKTRAAFKADPTLFAEDKFHPNARGYALWKPVINDAIDRALSKTKKSIRE